MNQNDLRESHIRSILKACTWRLVASVTTLIICYAITGKCALALTITGVEGVIKMGVYYLHERAWQTVARGTLRDVFKFKRPPLDPNVLAYAGTNAQPQTRPS